MHAKFASQMMVDCGVLSQFGWLDLLSYFSNAKTLPTSQTYDSTKIINLIAIKIKF